MWQDAAARSSAPAPACAWTQSAHLLTGMRSNSVMAARHRLSLGLGLPSMLIRARITQGQGQRLPASTGQKTTPLHAVCLYME